MPRAALAAEPGTTLIAMNRMIEAAISVGMKASRRNAIRRSMAQPRPFSGSRPSRARSPSRPLLEPRVLQRLEEAGTHRLVVLEVAGMRDQDPAVDQRHDPHLRH